MSTPPSPTKLLYVQPFTPVNWFIFVAVTMVTVLSPFIPIFVFVPMIIGTIFYEFIYDNLEIDIAAGTVTRWKGVLLLPLFTKKTRPLSEVKNPFYQKRISRNTGKFLSATIYLVWHDGKKEAIAFPSTTEVAERMLVDLKGVIDGGPITSELAKEINPSGIWQVLRKISVVYLLLVTTTACLGGAVSKIIDASVAAVHSASVDKDPCGALVKCCEAQADDYGDRLKCKKIIKSVSKKGKGECRRFYQELVASGECK